MGFLILFLVLILLSMPISIALGISALYFLVSQTELPLMAVTQRMFTGVDSFALMAIPFFIIAGGLMNSGGVTKRLIDFANILVGWLRGGLAAVSIVGSMIFAGISGSSVADASGLGSLLIPTMNDEGYDPVYSAAINATSSTIGIIIPPSIPMVVLGALAMISVKDLFLGGAIPGILSGLAMLVVSIYISTKRKYPKHRLVSPKEALSITFKCLPAIIMPVLIIVGIVKGVVTPTEAGVMAVVYALLVGFFVYRELTVKKVVGVIKEAALQTSVVLLVIACASIVSWLLAYLTLPQAFAAWAIATFHSKTLILFVIGLTCLLTGTIIDVSPAIILLGSVFAPVALQAGIPPVQFGVVLIYALSVGLFTPPVGTTLIISSYIAKTSMMDSFKACLPFMFSMLFILAILILFPQVSCFLPSLFSPS